MWKWLKRFLLWIVAPVVGLAALFLAINFDSLGKLVIGGTIDTSPPAIPTQTKRPAILVFSKTNGFRHVDAIPAADAVFADMARRNGWGYYKTENGAAFSPEVLSRFDAVIFNNVSGDVFNASQRQALKDFLEKGGGFVGIHGSGGDPSYAWQWYARDVIGAQFIGHPLFPQFQEGTVVIEDRGHPATLALPGHLRLEDEWYSFAKSPRSAPGMLILATLDEKSYENKSLLGTDLSMGADHPIVWSHCIDKGRAFYSAIGHQAKTYDLPQYRAMLEGATRWALKLAGKGCEPDR